MRKALYGGTYNPIHYGHLRAAEEVRETLGLDTVLFVPAAEPPHKTYEGGVSPEARLSLVRLAIEGNPAFEASDIEIRRGGKSYTIDTVRELLSEGESALELSLMVGSDSFNDISSWCEYEELLKLASFVVVPRPGYPMKKPAEALPVELARKFWYDSEKNRYENSYGNTLTYLGTTLFGVSSSDIRERVRQGKSIRYLVPPAVEEYILTNSLYR